MTRDDIIRMAREAELLLDIGTTFPYAEDTDIGPMLEKFAALVAAAEREACAKACDQLSWKLNDDITRAAFTMAADTIRARGDQT